MECPFCAEEIKDDAVLCRYCQRDIGPFRITLRKLAGLESKLGESDSNAATLTERVAAIERKLDDLRERLLGLNGNHAAVVTPLPVVDDSFTAPRWWKVALMTTLVPIVLLLVAYFLTVMLYDLDTRVLRTLSILIPLPFGLWFARAARGRLGTGALIALVVGIVSVWSMSAILAWHDSVPLLPETPREWKEIIEYIASISFAHLTGAFVGRWLVQRRQGRRSPGKLARQLASVLSDDGGKQGNLLGRIQGVVEKVQKMLGYVLPVATAILSIYTGLKPFIKAFS